MLDNSTTLSVAISMIIILILWLILSFLKENSTATNEKHVRFADEPYIWWKEWKNSIIKFVKKICFTTHVENGILKSRKYTSDSQYAEIFDTQI